jgi:hypothetical protein
MRRLSLVLALLALMTVPALALSIAGLTASGIGGTHFREGVRPDDTSTDCPASELLSPVGAACLRG